MIYFHRILVINHGNKSGNNKRKIKLDLIFKFRVNVGKWSNILWKPCDVHIIIRMIVSRKSLVVGMCYKHLIEVIKFNFAFVEKNLWKLK